MTIKANEKGQALVLIVLAAVALFAFAALAIDGSIIFSDRRHAQNAADTAALEAALTKIRHGDWEAEGLARASSNGYNNNGSTNDVTVYNPPVDGPYQGNNQYIQVKIRSDVKTTFARVIGFNKATNHVQAVARASVPVLTTWFNGQALVATMPGCKTESSWPHDPFTVNGTAGTTIINSGIFVNSDCEDAYDQGGSSEVITDKGVCVVGSADYTRTFPIPNEDCPPQNTDMYTLPNPGCGGPGEIVEVSPGHYSASPGTYSGSFPKAAAPGGSSGELKLEKGIYCFDNGIDVAGTWDLTTNLNDNFDAHGKPIHDSESEGVFLFVRKGGVTFNGGSDIQIHAIDSLSDNFPEALLNYLIYLPPSNKETVKITGGNESSFTGTILAPNAHIMLDGGSGTVGLNSQIIGFSVAISGNGTLDINFNQSKNGWTTTQPGVELSQ